MGRRAPEFAVGKLTEVLESLATQALFEIRNSETEALVEPGIAMKVQEMFSHCRNYMSLFMTLKLDFWQ